MENSRDSSIWRSLAVALGDGLAFGVGMAISQKAARRDAAPRTGSDPAADRLQELERRMALLDSAPARLDPKVLETIVGVFETDLRDRDEQWSRRLAAAVESAVGALRQEQADALRTQSERLAAELADRDAEWSRRLTGAVESASAALRQEQVEAATSLRQDVVADLRTLESQGIAIRQEIAEAVPQMVEEKMAASLDAGAMDAAIERKVEALRAEIAGRDGEIAELRERLASSEQRMLDLLSAIGLACRQAAERTSAPPAAVSETTPEAAVEAPHTAPGAQTDVPRFEMESAPKWTLPMVSSLLVASSCLAFLQHWL